MTKMPFAGCGVRPVVGGPSPAVCPSSRPREHPPAPVASRFHSAADPAADAAAGALEALGARVEHNEDGDGPAGRGRRFLVRLSPRRRRGIEVADGTSTASCTLRLTHSHATDAGMKELAGLKNLQELVLANTAVGDAGLKRAYGAWKALRRLDLSYTRGHRRGDAGSSAELTDLQELNLEGAVDGKERRSPTRASRNWPGCGEPATPEPVRSEGHGRRASRNWPGWHDLRELNLESTDVTDAGVEGTGGTAATRSIDAGRRPADGRGAQGFGGGG